MFQLLGELKIDKEQEVVPLFITDLLLSYFQIFHKIKLTK